MITAPLPDNEIERLSSLFSYDILDTLPEQDYDSITKIAAAICGTSISSISLIDTDRQWFKSIVGLDFTETPRQEAFCAHAILNPGELMEVPDARKDERFQDYPNVVNEPFINFYAGVPLISDDGNPLGTLCVIDTLPKKLTEDQKELLKALAQQVSNLLVLRKRTIELERSRAELKDINKDLEQLSQTIASDMKAPGKTIETVTELLINKYQGTIDADGIQMMHILKHSAKSLNNLVVETLEHATTVYQDNLVKERFTLGDLISDAILSLDQEALPEVRTDDSNTLLYTYRPQLARILVHLLDNAIKFNNNPVKQIEISVVEESRWYKFSVSDNGYGIPVLERNKIFELFYLVEEDRAPHMEGYGIGLNSVKKIVEKLGGKIKVYSELNEGSTFEFTIRK